MHSDRFADDEAIADELADCLARVRVGDLVDFVWVEPDLAFAAADHGGGEALLCAEIDPVASESGLARYDWDWVLTVWEFVGCVKRLWESELGEFVVPEMASSENHKTRILLTSWMSVCGC